MKRLRKSISAVLTVLLIILSLNGLNVFAEESTITVSGANGNATHIEKGTSMKMVASGVTQGKSVQWSVTDLDGSATDLATIVSTGNLTGILTASSDKYGSIKVIATQNDATEKKGEQVIHITNENLVTVDDTDSSIKYESAGSGEIWSDSSNSGYYQGTGKCVVPPEDDSYSSSSPAYAEFTFTGTGVQWIGESNYYCGVAEVYLDGIKVSTVDPFIAPSVISQFINFSREGLTYGQHTIKVVATGLKNPASTVYPGTRVLVDAFRYVTETQQADKTALQAKISEAQGLNADSYTQETWAVLQSALNSAIAVNANTNTTQQEVDAATDSLQAAISGLILKGPAVSITVAERVQPGEEFILTLSLINLNQTVHAEDITLTYDTGLFEYLKTEGVSSDIMVPDPKPPVMGVLKILAANTNGISANAPILNISFKARNAEEPMTGTIAVTDAKLGIAPEGTVIQAGLASKTIAIGNAPVVDKTLLSEAISSADTLFAGAVAGSQPGQYPQSAKDAFKNAIDAAKAVLNNSNATQTEVNAAAAALNTAINVFKSAKIPESSGDVNNNGTVDVADLGLVAYYYGADSQSSNWETAKAFDVNNDGIIDILDLAYIASKM